MCLECFRKYHRETDCPPRSYGVVVGRFQTPYLHLGHMDLIRRVQQRHDKLVIVLGSPTSRLSDRDPLDATLRAGMIHQAFPDADILHINDVPSDKQWSKDLDYMLAFKYPKDRPVLYGGRDSFIKRYTGVYECVQLPTLTPGKSPYPASSTDIRESIHAEHNEDFRRGVIYAAKSQFPTSYQAVDTAVVDVSLRRVLLGTKRTDCGKWRFVGGFVDPADETLERAAKREVCEEAGNIETANYTYLGSARIDDVRYRTDRHKVMSALFVAKYIFGAPVAGDDLDDVRWFPLDEMMDVLVPHHRVLGEMLLNHLGRS